MTGARHALIIANDRYADQGLKQLRAPAEDATALAGVLHDPQIGDFEVDVVRNAPADTMRRRIQGFFNDRRRDDTLVLHFSCHGLKSESGELYFAASDTEPRLLDATAIPAHFVRGCMSRTRAGRSVLFLDCCYGGAFSRGSSSVRASGDVDVLETFTHDRPPGGRGWAVITASSSMEFAFEGDELAENSAPRPSVFTHAVVQGLETGEADLDADGEVSLDDLYDYVFDRVQEQNPHQTPSKTVEMQGELHLAHSRRGRIKIAALPSPPSLLAAVNSDNAFTRQGAVLELRSRLRNDSLALAEGARQALEEVQRNDIQQIADQASRALRDIRLAPSPDHLDFGPVPKGSTPEERAVTMTGPPLARHCVVQPGQSWLHVEPTASGLRVRIDTAVEGPLSGDIALKGVAEEAVIRVEAVVVAAPASEPTTDATGPADGSAAGDQDTVVVGPSGGPQERHRPPGSTGDVSRTTADETETRVDLTNPHRNTTHHTRREQDEAGQESGTAGRESSEARRERDEAGREWGEARRAGGRARRDQDEARRERDRTGRERDEARRKRDRTGREAGGRTATASRRAPALAGAALALAAAAVITLLVTLQKAVAAVLDRSEEGPSGNIEDNVQEHGVLPLLTASLITAAVALAVGAFARHDLGARQGPFARSSTHGTWSMTAVAKGLAVPVLILALLVLVAYLVGRGSW
ncbi:caspase family protein [Streptomyces sp. NPDC057456]|uniref:caspase, EACC1-associated type n=1 Tax=Streptomyces sp. NPDC057456 TaxID=3346139 RepID=UPI00367D7029